MIKFIDFISRKEAMSLRVSDEIGIISIFSPEDGKCLSNDWKYKLELSFHDTNGVDLANPNSYATRGLVHFNSEHAKEIIKFLDLIYKSEDVYYLIIHCFAGVSRSAAVAKFAADVIFKTTNFPYHGYTLYNKFIYRKLLYIFGKLQASTI